MLIRLVGLTLAILSIALVCYLATSYTGQQWSLWRTAAITACLTVGTFGTVLVVFGSGPRKSAG
jgi:hypothetical protein